MNHKKKKCIFWDKKTIKKLCTVEGLYFIAGLKKIALFLGERNNLHRKYKRVKGRLTWVDWTKKQWVSSYCQGFFIKKTFFRLLPITAEWTVIFFSLFSDGQVKKKKQKRKLIQKENSVLKKSFFSFYFIYLSFFFFLSKLSNSKKNFFFFVGSLAQQYNLSFNLFTWYCILVESRDGISFNWVRVEVMWHF